MKKFVIFCAFLAVMAFTACSSSSTPNIGGTVNPDTDTNITPDTNTNSDETPVQDNNSTPDETPVVDNEQPKPDNDSVTPGKNCATDKECGEGNICAEGKCAAGCKSDADCSSFAGTTCNTVLGRCLNEKTDGSVCSEGCGTCCYAGIGLKKMKCAPSADAQFCGTCPQGYVFEPSSAKKCVPASCAMTSNICSTLATTNASCMECNSSTNVCQEKSGCTGYYTLDAASCVPTGEACTKDSNCCSGQPCIQGYCY